MNTTPLSEMETLEMIEHRIRREIPTFAQAAPHSGQWRDRPAEEYRRDLLALIADAKQKAGR